MFNITLNKACIRTLETPHEYLYRQYKVQLCKLCIIIGNSNPLLYSHPNCSYTCTYHLHNICMLQKYDTPPLATSSVQLEHNSRRLNKRELQLKALRIIHKQRFVVHQLSAVIPSRGLAIVHYQKGTPINVQTSMHQLYKLLRFTSVEEQVDRELY